MLSALYAMIAIVRPSVCPSVRRVDHRKTVEVRIMKFSPYGSPIPLVFAGISFIQKFWEFPPSGRVKQGRGGENQHAVFLSLSVKISKMVADTAKVTIND